MTNHPDQDIDTVLSALRVAEPPAGMERRVLAAIESRAAAPQPVLFRRRSPLPMAVRPTHLVAGGLAAVVAVAAVLLSVTHDRRHASPVVNAPVAEVTDAPRDREVLSEARVHAGVQVPPQRTLAPRRPASVSSPRRTEGAATLDGHAAEADPDALALAEMRAPSLLAPPLPLTRQEKLLLRVVHKGDPEPEAILNGELRAKQLVEQEADFYKFFGRPKPPAETEENSSTTTKGQGQ